MAEEVKDQKQAPAAEVGRKPKKKKSQPTNCLQSNKRIRRKDWYYREGQYFANKTCYKLWVADQAKKAVAEKEKQAAASAAAPEAASA